MLTDEGLRALSSLPALTFLDLRACPKVTAAVVQILCSTTCTAAPILHIITRREERRGMVAPPVLYWTESRFPATGTCTMALRC